MASTARTGATRLRKLLIPLAVIGALAVPASANAFDRPSPGAPGLGDRLFPTLGNGGYDVQHYDLDLRYATSAPSQGIDGTVTILAPRRSRCRASTSTSPATRSAPSASTVCPRSSRATARSS